MTSYAEQLRKVKSYGLITGESVRVACPFCGKPGTFTIAKERGTLMWYCFRASCDSRGRADDEYTKADLLARIEVVQKEFTVPDHFTGVQSHKHVMKYLQDNNCIDAVWDHRAEVMYDPQQNRCVFLTRKEGVICDAVGRILDKRGYPKWFRYGSSSSGLVVGHAGSSGGISCVAVEDAASACAVSCVADGYSLLGTNLTADHILDLRHYEQVYIALDPDAIQKAIKMQRTLSAFTRCKVWFIEDDLKYFNREQVAEMFKKETEDD